MIACYLEDIHSEVLEVEGDAFTHLASSLRVRNGDNVLALDGKGNSRLCEVSNLGKRRLELIGGKIETHTRKINLDILLSSPKRDSLNECLRAACELGIRKIYLYSSEYCQNRKIDLNRMKKILVSSLVQSNNPFLPEVVNLGEDLTQLAKYDKCFLFHLDESVEMPKISSLYASENYLLSLGPEGGFSERDISSIKESLENVDIINIPTPILRTHTALCAASGWVLSKV